MLTYPGSEQTPIWKGNFITGKTFSTVKACPNCGNTMEKLWKQCHTTFSLFRDVELMMNVLEIMCLKMLRNYVKSH